MFGDARSLWSTATNAFATINENISTALEQIDAEIDAQEQSQAVDHEQIRTDLDAYKALLDDAQMQHFELSKQSRIMLAEKEAEIQLLKSQVGGAATGGNGVAGDVELDLKYVKLYAEKKTLEASLLEAQDQLRRAIHDQNEYTVLKKTYAELQARFQTVKADLAELKADAEARDRQKSETIDNLVAEYSKLAAETELYQQQADQRVAEVLKENEILATKMHALEHSITELADRTVSPSPPVGTSASSIATAGLMTPSSSSRASSRTDLQQQQHGTASGGVAATDMELKEARSKIVNLQFDVREREGEIAKLKAALIAATAVSVEASPAKAAPSTTAGAAEGDAAEALGKLRDETARCEELARALQKLQLEYDNQCRDVSRLNTEKKEADDAGRKYLEQYKQAKEQCEALVRQQRQLEEKQAAAASDDATASASAGAVTAQLQAELAALKAQLAEAQQVHQSALAAAAAERETLVATHATELATLKSEQGAITAGSAEIEKVVAQLQAELATLSAQLETATKAHAAALTAVEQDAAAKLAAVQAELERATREVAQKTDELTEAKAAHDAQLQASLSGGDSERQQLVASYTSQVSALQDEVSGLQSQLREQSSQLDAIKAEAATTAQESAAKVAQLAADLQRTQSELGAAQAEVASLAAALQSAAGEQGEALAQARAEATRLRGELRTAAEALETERATAATAVKDLEQQIADQKQEVAEAHLAKDAAAGQLADKAQELIAAKAEFEEKLQASLSGNDAAREALVADYQQRIAVLQTEVASTQQTLAERDAQISALNGDIEAAQAEITRLTETVRDLSAQLAASAQALKEQAELHLTELQEKETAAQAELAAERERAAEQLRSYEESMGVMRDSHREELLAELDALRQELTSEHTAAQEHALAAAAAAALEAQTAALGTLQERLESEFATKEAVARDAAAEAQAAAVTANTATLQAEKQVALEEQATANERALAAALAALAAEKDAAQVAALETLRQEKKQELEAALAELRAAAAAQLESTKTEYEARIAELSAQIDALKADLASADARHKELTERALADQGAQKDAERVQALAALRQELKGEIDAAYKERDEHLENYSKERKLRKKIHNRLLEIQGNIRVICRVRPILEVERRSGEDVDVTEVPNDEELFVQRDQQCRTRYEYDRVFAQSATQEEVFEAVQPLCVSVLDGYNVCIFAYGQTGSGKTFTMEGSAANKGVSPRAIGELLAQIDAMKDQCTYTVTLSMLEIYNETILDLLPANPAGKEKEKLDIRQTPEGNQVVGLNETAITSMAQVEELMRQGQKNRAVGSHDMNEHSSRSHSIITVVCRGRNLLDGTTTYGKLHLIDLAGSERVGKTDATGDRLKEAQNINKSLSALGEVINALGNKKATHVPYRNSKLTFLLQDSLGGNSKVLTFVNISPAVYNLGETVCSLNFATRCRSTELGQAKKQSGEESAAKPTPRRLTSASSSASLNSSALLTPAPKK